VAVLWSRVKGIIFARLYNCNSLYSCLRRNGIIVHVSIAIVELNLRSCVFTKSSVDMKRFGDSVG